MNKLVTVRTFSQSIDFEMTKSYLESYGIECFGKNEIINRAYIDLVDGGIQLQVPEERVEEAIKLLFEKGYLKAEDFEPSMEMKWMEKVLNYFKKKYVKTIVHSVSGKLLCYACKIVLWQKR